MEILMKLVDILMHLDVHIAWLVNTYGVWTYVILFSIVFLETGIVVTPMLPGDSLLFTVGAVAATGALKPLWVCVVLGFAAIAGDTLNYWIGHYLGPRVFQSDKSRFLNREHLQRTHHFFETYGGKTIIIARFVPIVRTFAPFVAGVGSMRYFKFLLYNIIGGVMWVIICVYAGVFFGNLPFVKKHFELVLLGIIGVSLLPTMVEYFLHSSQSIKPGNP